MRRAAFWLQFQTGSDRLRMERIMKPANVARCGHSRSHSAGEDGFTLIELIVVIAIIALLAALLLPALSRAKQAGYSAVCKNNLHQWGIGLRLYLDEYSVFPPDQMSDGTPVGKDRWRSRMAKCMGIPDPPWSYVPIFGESAQEGIQVCPGLVRTTRLAVGGGVIRGLGSYGYNAHGAGYAANGKQLGLDGQILDEWYRPMTAPENLRLTREDQVVKPSDMIAIADAIVGWGFWGFADPDAAGALDHLMPWGGEAISIILGRPSQASFFTVADVKAMRAAVQRRHGGRWNVLFCDGHVEHLTTPDFLDIRKASVRMRWNNDNLPHDNPAFYQ